MYRSNKKKNNRLAFDITIYIHTRTSQAYTISWEMMDSNEMRVFVMAISTEEVDDVKSSYFGTSLRVLH